VAKADRKAEFRRRWFVLRQLIHVFIANTQLKHDIVVFSFLDTHEKSLIASDQRNTHDKR
jgi:hypothetical protein